ncbi:MAG: glycosyltransferase [Candidatus Binatia bacterium]
MASSSSGGPARLAVFLPSLLVGGTQRRTLRLAHACAARGYAVDLVVVRPRGPFRQELSPLVRLVSLNPWWTHLPWSARRHDNRTFENAPALARYLRRIKPDVLLSTSNHSNRIALLAHHLARVPTRLVLTVGNHLSPPDRSAAARSMRLLRLWLARWWYPWADAIVAVSDGVADNVAQVTGLPRTRITTIYNAVVTADLEAKMQAPLAHPWFVPGAPPVLLGAGRLTAQKDFPTLLRAYARVRAVRDARLVILGDGKKRRQLEALARKLGLEAEIDLPGFVTNPFAYMARAAVFVLSSRWEGFSNVIAEALACGCPVVSTDCPSGSAEILADGTYGRLVPVGDDVKLAAAILCTLETPPDRQRLRARAEHFSVERATDRYLEVMLGTGGRPPACERPSFVQPS